MAQSPHAVLETSLYVADLDRAVAFYENVLGLCRISEGYFEGGRGAALQVGSGASVLLLFRADKLGSEEFSPPMVRRAPATSLFGSSRRSVIHGGSDCVSMAWP